MDCAPTDLQNKPIKVLQSSAGLRLFHWENQTFVYSREYFVFP